MQFAITALVAFAAYSAVGAQTTSKGGPGPGVTIPLDGCAGYADGYYCAYADNSGDQWIVECVGGSGHEISDCTTSGEVCKYTNNQAYCAGS